MLCTALATTSFSNGLAKAWGLLRGTCPWLKAVVSAKRLFVWRAHTPATARSRGRLAPARQGLFFPTPVEYSFSAAVEAVNSALLQLSQQRAAALEEVYRQMLLEIRQAPVRIRPDRSYPRRREGKRNKGHDKYILPARLENP